MPITWKDIESDKRYKGAGIVERDSIKRRFFEEIIKTDPEFPADQEELLRNRFMGLEESSPLPPVEGQREGAISSALRMTPPGQLASAYVPLLADPLTTVQKVAHTAASALEGASAGASRLAGLGKEGVEAELKKKGIPQGQLEVSSTLGELAGIGFSFPALYKKLGGSVVSSYMLNSGMQTGALRTAISKALGWATTGAAYDAISGSMDELYKKAMGENPKLEESLGRIGIKTGEGFAKFMAFDLALQGVGSAGNKFLGSKVGQSLVAKIGSVLKSNDPADVAIREVVTTQAEKAAAEPISGANVPQLIQSSPFVGGLENPAAPEINRILSQPAYKDAVGILTNADDLAKALPNEAPTIIANAAEKAVKTVPHLIIPKQTVFSPQEPLHVSYIADTRSGRGEVLTMLRYQQIRKIQDDIATKGFSLDEEGNRIWKVTNFFPIKPTLDSKTGLAGLAAVTALTSFFFGDDEAQASTKSEVVEKAAAKVEPTKVW